MRVQERRIPFVDIEFVWTIFFFSERIAKCLVLHSCVKILPRFGSNVCCKGVISKNLPFFSRWLPIFIISIISPFDQMHPTQPHQIILGTQSCFSVFDQRMATRPVLLWNHNLPNPPVLLDVASTHKDDRERVFLTAAGVHDSVMQLYECSRERVKHASYG